jgi:DNA invertase Pin-like site-specific DNA recombinase
MKVKKNIGNPKIAIGYARVSKEEQRLGPEAQRANIESWAAREGIQVASWHIDQGVSSVAPIEERPGLCAALAALREHNAGILVVAKRDRLARDPALTASIERAVSRAGAIIQSAAGEGNGETPGDEFMRGIIDSMARYERALIRSRTRDALKAKAAKGERVGSVPFGSALSKDGIRLEPSAEEQATIAEARAMAAEGMSLRSIANSLATSGRLSRRGRPFQATQIMRMVG